MAKIKNESYIPLKNYVIAFVIIIVAILAVWYGFAWYKVLEENKISTSYLIKEKVITKEIDNIDMVDDIFSEAPNTYYLYISYTGDENVYNMEKDIAKVIKDFDISDSFYYLNVTDIKGDKDLLDKINTKLSLEEKKVSKVPTIVYFKNGEVVDMITRKDDSIMNVDDFKRLLDINRITKE